MCVWGGGGGAMVVVPSFVVKYLVSSFAQSSCWKVALLLLPFNVI